MRDWFNDGIHRRGKCETVFKVYILDDVEDAGFCPVCGSRIDGETDLTEEELEELEQ